MTRVAALFPGQGSQFVGMGHDLARRWSEARDAFATADEALGTSLTALCWEGPEDDLKLTVNTQPALVATSAGAWRVLSSSGLRVDGVAGHSLGEYSAAVAAGGLDLAEALRLVRLRGRLMQEAVPMGEGAMAAVIGLADEAVIEACKAAWEELGEPVVPANFNAPGQVVISGTVAAVDAAGDGCRERGARRVVPLVVSAPFHSPLMHPAREGLTPALAEAEIRDLEVPLYRNVDAAPVLRSEDVRDGLIRQVDSPVLWTDTVRRLARDGFDTFVEVGAGTVLSGLVRRVDRGLRCLPAGTVEEVELVICELGGKAGGRVEHD